jgi:hypothetical protein
MLFRYADSETYVSKYPNDMLAKALSQTKNLRNGTAFYQLMSKAYSKNEKMAKNYKSLGIEISDNLLLTLAVKDEEPISASELSSGEVGDIKLMTVCLDTLTNGLFSVIFADNPTNDILASGGLVTASMEPVNVEANTEEYIKSIISRYPNKSTSSFAALEIIIKQADDYSQINDYITKGINNCRCLHTSDKNTIYSIKSDRYTCYLAVCIGDSNLCRANPDPYGRCYYDGKDVHYFPSGYLTMISEDPIENGRPKRPLDVILSKVIS